MKIWGSFFLLFSFSQALLAQELVNVYAWGGEIPQSLIQKFEKETQIKVNFSTYDSNETLYAKLKASRNQNSYDVIIPSAYFVERMKKQGLLEALDHQQLSNLKNIDPFFLNNSYDPQNQFSLPLIWGATGIFFNSRASTSKPALLPKSWRDLWTPQWQKQLMLLDDSREIFAIGLMSLGYSPNDANPLHIKAAYEHLLALIPNIKLFASDSIQAIMIDEDANAGVAWNGDVLKAQAENPNIHFVFPSEGFVIWVDCLAIPKNPPHPKTAYQFINFLLRPDSGAEIALQEGHAITNQQAKQILPEQITKNPLTYPPQKILAHGYFQRDVGEEALALYNLYWQKFKLAF